MALGRIPDTTTEVMLNLDAAGVVEACGTPRAAAELVYAAAVALTGLPWANAADVILVGFGEHLAAGAAHIRSVGSLDDIAGELATLAADDEGQPPPTPGRSRGGARNEATGRTATVLSASTPWTRLAWTGYEPVRPRERAERPDRE